MDASIFNTNAHLNVTSATNSNINIITKYDAAIKEYSSMETIQTH